MTDINLSVKINYVYNLVNITNITKINYVYNLVNIMNITKDQLEWFILCNQVTRLIAFPFLGHVRYCLTPLVEGIMYRVFSQFLVSHMVS